MCFFLETRCNSDFPLDQEELKIQTTMNIEIQSLEICYENMSLKQLGPIS